MSYIVQYSRFTLYTAKEFESMGEDKSNDDCWKCELGKWKFDEIHPTSRVNLHLFCSDS